MKISGGWVLAFLVIACGDSGGSSTPDGGMGAKCTGALYDKCAGAGDCMSGTCGSTPALGMFCTRACTPSEMCPMAGDVTVTCSNMGFCTPTATNSCSL
jgi:hypothetical protein